MICLEDGVGKGTGDGSGSGSESEGSEAADGVRRDE